MHRREAEGEQECRRSVPAKVPGATDEDARRQQDEGQDHPRQVEHRLVVVVVTLHRGFSDKTDAPALAEHARTVLPKIEAHLERAKQLQSNLAG